MTKKKAEKFEVTEQGKSIFKLETNLVLLKYNKKKDIYLPPSYPWGLYRYVSYYTSLREAESGMLKHIDYYKKEITMDKPYGIYGFLVSEYGINTMSWNEPLTLRVYLPDGKLEESSLTSECKHIHADGTFSLTPFMGRKPEEIRFKKGDMVEVIGSDYFCIIIDTPPTESEIKEYMQKDEGMGFDYRDDCYTVLDCNLKGKEVGSSRRRSINVLSPRFPIPKKLAESLQTTYCSYCNKNNTGRE
jgi:hypothetical protein